MAITEDELDANHAAFDATVNAPRKGWKQELANSGLPPLEKWTRKAAGMIATVYFYPSPSGRGRGWAPFLVENETGELLESGESSRRGWAMDCADEVLQRRLN